MPFWQVQQNLLAHRALYSSHTQARPTPAAAGPYGCFRLFANTSSLSRSFGATESVPYPPSWGFSVMMKPPEGFVVKAKRLKLVK